MPYLPQKTKRKSHNHKKRPFYNTKEWKRASALCLELNPNCVACGNPATTADHKVSPWLHGGSKTDQKNLQSMCRSCHNRKSARDRNEYYNNK